MQIAQPLWVLGAVASAALLFWSYRRLESRRVALLGAFASSRLMLELTRSVSLQRIWLKRIAMIAATVCICAALARPQGAYVAETLHSTGLDILVAIDTSKSMLTPDVKPNRLTRAKLAAEDLLERLHGDSIGLVAFAGDAFLQSPITTDYDAFRDSVEALDTNTIPRGGTDIAAAIRVARAAFRTRASSDRILILVTDGEDLGAQGIEAARAAAQRGLRIFTLGVGTAAGDLIPLPDGNGGTHYVQDSSGQSVRSHLDVATLQQIAQVGGGTYEPLGDQGQGLASIYSRGLASFTRHDLADRSYRVHTEWFQWPLLAGLVLLVAESLLLTRRRGIERKERPQGQVAHPLTARKARAVPGALLGFGLGIGLAFGITTLPGIAHASTDDAEKDYQRGDFAKAGKEYEASARKRPSEAQLQFNVGAAAYKSGNLNAAATAFQTAIKTGVPTVQQSAYYNLGNTQYRLGERDQKANRQQTIERWQGAVKSYTTALQMRPGDADAKFNRDFVQRKIDELQQPPPPPQSGGGQQQQPPGGGQQQKSPGQGQAQNSGTDPKQGQGQNHGQGQNQGQGQGQNPPRDPGSNQSAPNPPPQPAGPTQPTPATPGSSSSQPGTGQPVAAAGTPSGNPPDQSATGAADAGPGQLTRDEAEHLLDSLKGDEKRMSATALGPNANAAVDSPPLKDW